MIEEFSFDYTYKGKKRTKIIVTYSLQEAFDRAAMFLEGLNEDLDLVGLDTWEDIQDACAECGIDVDELIVKDE